MNSIQKRTDRSLLALTIAATLGCGLAASNANAFSFSKGEITGSLDTTITYGASWRVQDRDEDNVGKVNLNPAVSLLSNEEQRAAPGRFSNNSDDGNLKYDSGDLISHAARITTELGVNWRNYGAFFRANYFYDFENEGRDDLTDIAQEFVGSDFTLLDAFIYGDFDVGDQFATVRLGRQVVSWGENTFIQGGINVINPVDVSKLRAAGSELKEAFQPQDMIWGSISLTDQLSVEGFYLFEYDQIDVDPAGTYFSTNDFATYGGEFVMLGFGLFDEGTPGVTIPRAADRYPGENGQFGLAMRYYAPEINDTEFGFYFINYHSRLPLISGTSVTGPSPSTGRYFIEYPEDIRLYGLSWNTTLGTISFAGEMSYRDNLPLQIDDVEVLFLALTPLNGGIGSPANRFNSQLGTVGFGEEIQGWERHESAQLQGTFTKLFGPNNPFKADQIVGVLEIGMNKVFDLPSQDQLRYNGNGTDTGGGDDVLSGQLRNPQTQEGGFATDFSWGYRFATRFDYNSVFGSPFNVSPRLAFNHDVQGYTPGPGGSFIEDRKSLTLGIGGSYLERWGADLSYTRFFGAEQFNLIHDRDFIAASIRYAF